MLKDKRKKDEVIEALTASDGLSRKEFEKELAKLQVELTRLQQRRPKNVTEGLGGTGQPIPNHY